MEPAEPGGGRVHDACLPTAVNAQFSPWISIGNNLQYDNVTKVLGWQARFRWILRPGNDFYIVYAHNWRELEPERFATLDRRAVSKIAYTHRF